MKHASNAHNTADTIARVQDDAADAFRAGRTATADGLDTAANRLNSGADRVAEVAHSAADKITASASYVRDNDARHMVRDIESLVKAHPGKALIGAVAIGYLFARVFRRD